MSLKAVEKQERLNRRMISAVKTKSSLLIIFEIKINQILELAF